MSAFENEKLHDRHPDEQSLSAYHDGQLDAVQTTVVGRHLTNCPACVAELTRLAALSTLMQRHRPVLSPIGRSRIHRQIDRVMSGAADSALIRFGLRVSGVAASVLLLGTIALMMMGAQTQAPASANEAAPPWVGVAVSSETDTIVQNASTPAAAIYLADATAADGGN